MLTTHYADLSLVADVKRVGAEIAAAEPRVDVLINNAGSMFGVRKITAEGLERTFALNHMSYFVLTHGLRERLHAAAPSRVVNTASAAHLRATLDFDDLESAGTYRARVAYGRSPHTDQLHVVERWKLAADGKTVDVSISWRTPARSPRPGRRYSAGAALKTRQSRLSRATRTTAISSARGWCRCPKRRSPIFDLVEYLFADLPKAWADAPARNSRRRLPEIGGIALSAPTTNSDADSARTFCGKLKTARRRHGQMCHLGDDCAERTMPQPFLETGEQRLIIACLHIDDAVGQ